MNVRAHSYGYTMVEVMIFLAVSAGLFLGASTLLVGQRERTEFAQAIRDTETQIQDVLNDVSTGYYGGSIYKCSAAPGFSQPTVNYLITADLGTNRECIFIGRVMKFTVGETIEVYNVLGRRKVGTYPSETEAAGLTQAKPTALNLAYSGEKRTLEGGLKIKGMKLGTGSTATNVAAFGFFSNFGQYNSLTGFTDDLISGAQTVDLIPLPGVLTPLTLSSGEAEVATEISQVNDTSPKNPADGIVICLQGEGTDQVGIITVGSNNRQLSTRLDIYDEAPTTGLHAGACV